MKYQINLTDDDYLRFNIFYAYHSKAGKHSLHTTRMVFPVLSLAFILIFFMAGAAYGLILTEAAVLTIASAIWYFYTPKLIEKNIRKNIGRIKTDGKLPFYAVSEVEFQDSGIVERHAQSEIHINYKDIENIYAETDYLYIFYSALQALILPRRCLGNDAQRVTEFLINKKS